MSTSAKKKKVKERQWSRSYRPNSARAVEVTCDADALVVTLEDGRVVQIPLAWFPALASATPKQRARCEIAGGGTSLHWEDIDEDLTVANLLAGGDTTSA